LPPPAPPNPPPPPPPGTGVRPDGGGGVFNLGLMHMSECMVRGNVAADGGAGGGLFNAGELMLLDTSVSDCTAAVGGGLYSLGATGNTTGKQETNVENCNISHNRADLGGGIGSGGAMSLAATLVSANLAVDGAGPPRVSSPRLLLPCATRLPFHPLSPSAQAS